MRQRLRMHRLPRLWTGWLWTGWLGTGRLGTGRLWRSQREAGWRGQRGFALLIVLWTVGFLALLGIRIVAAGRSDTQLADNLKQDAVLQAAADGAVANVMFSILAARDPNLRTDGVVREIRVGRTPVLVQVERETDRINLNTASPALLQALIVDVGIAPALAQRLAIAIASWRNNGTVAGQDGSPRQQYRSAGLLYGPPGTPFQSVDELLDVVGMTSALFERLAPHLTVLTQDDPDMNTRDPIVAQALADAAGVASFTMVPLQNTDDAVLRIVATAVGSGNARYDLLVVASANFQDVTPRLNILSRTRINRDAGAAVIAASS